MTKKNTQVIEGKIVEKKPKSKAIAKVENKVITQNSAEMLITRAIDKNVSVETMERLLKMRRELKAEFAKEEFDKAMAQFQANCPEVKKTKEVRTKSGQVAYRYAPIEAIVRQVKSVLQRNGFSYSIQTETEPGKVKSICIVKHIAGHSESYNMEVPLGNKTQVMSDSQVVAAASTFSKRYAFCNAFGILTGDGDDDGANTSTGYQNSNESKPQKSEPKDIKTTIRDAIKFAKTTSHVITIDQKTSKSKKFDDKFKKEIHKLADNKVSEIEYAKEKK